MLCSRAIYKCANPIAPISGAQSHAKSYLNLKFLSIIDLHAGTLSCTMFLQYILYILTDNISLKLHYFNFNASFQNIFILFENLFYKIFYKLLKFKKIVIFLSFLQNINRIFDRMQSTCYILSKLEALSVQTLLLSLLPWMYAQRW